MCVCVADVVDAKKRINAVKGPRPKRVKEEPVDGNGGAEHSSDSE